MTSKHIGFSALVGALSTLSAVAAVPNSALLTEKGYTPERIAGLTAPQKGEIYTGAELKWIGMPIGGLFAGQVYVGGDGDLWCWDIHNVQTQNPGGTGDKYYANPMSQDEYKRIDQGFAVTVKKDGATKTYPLNRKGFKDITFCGSYPMADVTYADASSPVTVSLKAYTPFAPLDTTFSSWPAVVLRYTVTNPTQESLTVSLGGWLQNTVGLYRGKDRIRHTNKIIRGTDSVQLVAGLTSASSYEEADMGDMTLTLMHPADSVFATVNTATGTLPAQNGAIQASVQGGTPLVGALAQAFTLKPGESKTCAFAITWYFPNINKGPGGVNGLTDIARSKNIYAKYFTSAVDVANQLTKQDATALARTQSWINTWNDSTLPAWFRNRTFLNVGTLATTVWSRLYNPFNPALDERSYCWEGVYLGDGTCTHVLHYEQAIGRIFPEIARNQREKVDYGLAFRDNGVIGYRAEHSGQGSHNGTGHAIDGHLGTILRMYREYTLTTDADMLNRLWPRIKHSIQIVIDQDKAKNGYADGILEGAQYNTLDRIWYGKITWISGLYAAALNAGEQMALATGDFAFANECRTIAQRAYTEIPAQLFKPAKIDGEFGYFIHKQDPKFPGTPNTADGCHIDQLLGVYWADQTGLPAILPEELVQEALRATFRYNFVTDFAAFIKDAAIKPSRFYAAAGEAGVTMCAFPKGVTASISPAGDSWQALATGYFTECWTGQEYPFAANLIHHGMPLEGLAVVEAVHARYAAEKRNPYNEIEYGNHYTRAMSSFAPYISICGFAYNAPASAITFSPKITPENFRAAYISAEAWGTYQQTITADQSQASILVTEGTLSLKKIALTLPTCPSHAVQVKVGERIIPATITYDGSTLSIMDISETITAGQTITITAKLR